jgi:hypothetical protein
MVFSTQRGLATSISKLTELLLPTPLSSFYCGGYKLSQIPLRQKSIFMIRFLLVQHRLIWYQVSTTTIFLNGFRHINHTYERV